MKITDVKTFPIFHGSRNYLFVKIETDAGLYGVGEFGITWKEQAGIGAIKHMKRHIIGLDPLNIEYIWQLLFRVDFFPGGRINTAAISEIEICIDVHTRLDPPDAIRLGRELEKYDPFFIEDPLRCENPQSYRNLRNHVSCPLAVGEHYATKWEFRQMIEEELLDYARIDLCIVGGLTEARKIANWCETHYIKIVPHNPLGPVSAAACAHLDIACDNFAVQEAGLVGRPVMKDLFPIQLPYEAGCLLPPNRPGLGLEFNDDAAENYEFKWLGGPQLRREDGSFTNW